MQDQKTKAPYSVEINEEDIISNLVHLGHRFSMRTSYMKKYIFGTKNSIDIFNVSDIKKNLEHACQLFYLAAKSKKKILFVSSIPSHKDLIEIAAKRCGAHYMSSWTGGTITNYFSVVESMKKKITYYDSLLEEAKISSLTKREVSLITKKREKIYDKLSGILEMKGLPDLIFVINSKIDALAITEASLSGIPVISICDTNASTRNITHVIPGNDDGRKSVSFILNIISNSIIEGVRGYMLEKGIDLSSIIDKK